ncbi:MAG: PDDEXK nuclease domain-containing protein [Candidatus Omnitrophota bacterium]|nr:PDDEXK nuclease domain-containing protein [Candidatus Omnitrophota bacterium]
MTKMVSSEYLGLLKAVRERVRSAQYSALKAVNKELIHLYWDIGKMIVERQFKHGWGKAIVETLARDLQAEFPGMQGFSARNIWYMRIFYVTYRKNGKLQPLVAEISWTKHLIIIDRCRDDFEREFYIRMTRKFGWTKNVLIHQIDNQGYKKTMVNQTNFDKALPEKIKNQAKLAVKDEYTFDFLELGEKHSEMELERALIVKVNQFLVEMGGTFAFMGNQFRLEIDGEEFFIDILLYHRRLKRLVAVELKVGKFLPEYVGKMQFYLAALDNMVREKGENTSIGIILCRDKKRTIVEYALKESKKPIAVSQYRITSTLPKNLRKELPAPEQIRKLFNEI